MPKSKPKQPKQKTQRKKVSRDLTAGLVGQMVPGFPQAAKALSKELIPALLEALPFPTSGASAIASPNLGLTGYNHSMSLSAPAANGTYVKHTKARMRSSKSGMKIEHREYVQDISFSDAGQFSLAVSLPINPGNRELFPWLSGIASRFETYRFNYLRFIYEPQCGTENEGTVMAAVDFDAVDPPPVDKLQFMTYDGAVRSPPWFASVYECSSYNLHKSKEYYITRSLTTPTSTDEKTYFVGNVYVATQSMSTTPITSGELYVEYSVSLMTPQLDSISSDQSYFAHITRANNAAPEVITNEWGSLDVLFDPIGWFNGTAEIVIAEPGAYAVTVMTGETAGNPSVSFSTASPPTGFIQAGLYQYNSINSANNVNYGVGSCLVASLTGPLWLSIVISTEEFNGMQSFLTVTPLDQTTYLGLAPFFTPALTPEIASRLQKLKKRLALAPRRADVTTTKPVIETTRTLANKPKPLR